MPTSPTMAANYLNRYNHQVINMILKNIDLCQ